MLKKPHATLLQTIVLLLLCRACLINQNLVSYEQQKPNTKPSLVQKAFRVQESNLPVSKFEASFLFLCFLSFPSLILDIPQNPVADPSASYYSIGNRCIVIVHTARILLGRSTLPIYKKEERR
jgi:hypothetical protein